MKSLKDRFLKVLDSFICEPTGSVRVVAKWMTGWLRNAGLILGKRERLFFLYNIKTVPRAHPASCLVSSRAWFLMLISPSTSDRLKYKWNKTSSPQKFSCFGAKTEHLFQYTCCVYEQLHSAGIFRTIQWCTWPLNTIICTSSLLHSCFGSLCVWHCTLFESNCPLKVYPYHNHS